MAGKPLLIGKLIAQALALHSRVKVPVDLAKILQHETVLLEPGKIVYLPALAQVPTSGLTDLIPNLFAGGNLICGQREVILVFTGEPRSPSTAIYRRNILSDEIGFDRKPGDNVRDVHRIVERLDSFLSNRPAFMVPVILRELGATDANELGALKVSRLWQQYIGKMIGFVHGVSKRHNERKLREAICDLGRIP